MKGPEPLSGLERFDFGLKERDKLKNLLNPFPSTVTNRYSFCLLMISSVFCEFHGFILGKMMGYNSFVVF